MKSLVSLTLLTTSILARSNDVVYTFGSSYAHGDGLSCQGNTYPNNQCNGSYGQLLANSLKTAYSESSTGFNDSALSGSILSSIYNLQAGRINSTTSIVAISSGGNNLNYVACLGSGGSACSPSPPVTSAGFTSEYMKALDAISGNLTKSVANATCVPIYIVDYPRALPPNTTTCGTGCKMNSTDISKALQIYENLINWTVDAFTTWKNNNPSATIRLIPMRQYSTGHEYNSTTPWINGAVQPSGTAGGAAWHPNPSGASAMASYVFSNLQATPIPGC